MQSEKREIPAGARATDGDSAKLLSLLALTAGAVAMPQTSNADIIYTNMTSSPALVGFAGGYSATFDLTLPGTAQFGFRTHQHTVYTYTGIGGSISFRTVTAGRMGSVQAGLQAQPNGFVLPLDNGAAWTQAVGLYYNASLGKATTFAHLPASGYSHKYLAFAFSDTSQGGAMRYGWIEVSLSIANIFGAGTGPNVTIFGYAYDTAGNRLSMGAIPEPSSAAILAFGAMILGAGGVRSWRRNRPAPES